METIMSFNTYNTDVFNSWGIGSIKKPIEMDFYDILKDAIEIKATLIVKPSRGNFWYIKGINNTKSYEEIKTQLETNLNSKYKSKSRTWLISYI
jgi:hypothetical protein